MIGLEVAIPLPGTPIGFLAGALTGYALGWALHADDVDENGEKVDSDWRRIYERVAPFLVVFCLAVSCLASVGVYATNAANHRQDKAAVEQRADQARETRALLACLDRFSTSLGTGLPPVRSATSDRDDALGRALTDPDGLRGLVRQITARTLTRGDLLRLERRLDKFDTADRHLDKVRKENPYPPPPSRACPALTKGKQ